MQHEAAINRMAYARLHLQEAGEFLRQQREELDSVRGKIFTQIVSLRSNIPTDTPPAYEDVTSRRETDAGDAEDQVPSSQSSEEVCQLAESLRHSLVLA